MNNLKKSNENYRPEVQLILDENPRLEINV